MEKIQPYLFFYIMFIEYKYEHIQYALHIDAVKFTEADTEVNILLLQEPKEMLTLIETKGMMKSTGKQLQT